MVLKNLAYISVSLIVLSACTQGEINTVDSGDKNAEVNGRLLYMNQCASCHGAKGNLGNSGSKDLSKSKLNEDAIMKIIMEGKGTMPPFEYLLETDQKREAVVQHVMSLRKK